MVREVRSCLLFSTLGVKLCPFCATVSFSCRDLQQPWSLAGGFSELKQLWGATRAEPELGCQDGDLCLPREPVGLCGSLEDACAMIQRGVCHFFWASLLHLKPVGFILEITSPALEVSISSHLISVFSGSGCLVQHYSDIAKSITAISKADTFCPSSFRLCWEPTYLSSL